MKLFNRRLGKYIEAKAISEHGVFAPDHLADLDYKTSFFDLDDFYLETVTIGKDL